ncbi:MAG: hypothetical protein KF833_17835 [Verrucomicrobiae bacterium]|nr:hypothetical protein [Verrucomicrobiae bacterium]
MRQHTPPIDETVLRANADAEIEYGNSVRAADRLEVLKPPHWEGFMAVP